MRENRRYSDSHWSVSAAEQRICWEMRRMLFSAAPQRISRCCITRNPYSERLVTLAQVASRHEMKDKSARCNPFNEPSPCQGQDWRWRGGKIASNRGKRTRVRRFKPSSGTRCSLDMKARRRWSALPPRIEESPVQIFPQ